MITELLRPRPSVVRLWSRVSLDHDGRGLLGRSRAGAMRRLVQRLLHRFGWHLAPYPFHSPHYLRHTARRLEHLAALGLPLEGKTVLEVGAGAGDFTHFFLDRGCTVTITDARPRNVRYLRGRYPGRDVRLLDLESPTLSAGGPWDIVHCYGVLYHTGKPERVLDWLASVCGELLLLETKVAPGPEPGVEDVSEDRHVPSMAVHGSGCLPARTWVRRALAERFEHVYTPVVQPYIEEFRTAGSESTGHGPVVRAIFVASRPALDSPLLRSASVGR